MSEPPAIITGLFFGYENNYIESDTIQPGKGYWVKVNSDGHLILGAGPGADLSKAIRIVPDPDLPPLPPEESDLLSSDNQPGYLLLEAYPNPFNPVTTITYSLPAESRVVIKIYDLLGEVVASLVEGRQRAGFNSVVWNPGGVTSGIYLCRFEASSLEEPQKSFREVRKIIYLK
jgi:Secretion system C-terminal sorting domain